MRLPDDKKRQQIIAVATRLFASEPFHKVRLDDVAAAAGVGKGTLYIYFQSKEALYCSIIGEGFVQLVERLKTELAEAHLSAWQRLVKIVEGLVDYAHQHPYLWELMRTVGPPKGAAKWHAKHHNLTELIETTIRDGVKAGELADPSPGLTALFIPGMVRAAMLHGYKGLNRAMLSGQILHLLERGVVVKKGTR